MSGSFSTRTRRARLIPAPGTSANTYNSAFDLTDNAVSRVTGFRYVDIGVVITLWALGLTDHVRYAPAL